MASADPIMEPTRLLVLTTPPSSSSRGSDSSYIVLVCMYYIYVRILYTTRIRTSAKGQSKQVLKERIQVAIMPIIIIIKRNMVYPQEQSRHRWDEDPVVTGVTRQAMI